MENVEILSRSTLPISQFGTRMRRAVMLVAAAVAAHVWVVPGFNAARTMPATSVLTAGVSLAPGFPAAVAVLDAGAPDRGIVRMRTELVKVGVLTSADATSRSTRSESVDTSLRAVRPQATEGTMRDRAVSVEKADTGSESTPAVVVPLTLQHTDDVADATTPAAPAGRPTTPPEVLPLLNVRLAQATTAVMAAAMPAAPPTVPDRAAALQREEEIVRQVLRDYAQAFERLDVQAAKALWPTLDDRALQRAFQQLDGQQLRFAACGVAVSGRDANARCRGDATYRPKVGSRTLRLTSREWTFNLSRDNDRWQIVNATLQ